MSIKVIIKATDCKSFDDELTTIKVDPDENGKTVDIKKEKDNKADDIVTVDEIVTKLIEGLKDKGLSAFGYDLKSKQITQNENKFYRDGKLNNDLFRLKKNQITGISNMVGTIRNTIEYNGMELDVTLLISSRFDRDKNNNVRSWFTGTMLSQILTGSEVYSSFNEVYKDENEMFKFMYVIIFANQLKKAHNSGVYKTYVRREYNDSRAKGCIDITRHLKLNLGREDRIAYTTREHTPDNSFNRFILHTWRSLRNKYPGFADLVWRSDKAFAAVIKELEHFTAADQETADRCFAKCLRPITGPYYVGYETLRQTCVALMREECDGVGIYGEADKDEFANGITFYMPDLWELYLEKHLSPLGFTSQEKIDTRDLKFYGSDIFDDNQKEFIDSVRTKYSDTASIRPDFVLDSGDMPMVLDAKHKIYIYNDKFTEVKYIKDINKLKRDILFLGMQMGIEPYTIGGGLIAPVTESEKKFYEKHKDKIDTKLMPLIKFYRILIPAENEYKSWIKALNENTINTINEIMEERKKQYEIKVKDLGKITQYYNKTTIIKEYKKELIINTMTDEDRKDNTQKFIKDWKDKGNSDSDSVDYWKQLLNNVLGVKFPDYIIKTVPPDKDISCFIAHIPFARIIFQDNTKDNSNSIEQALKFSNKQVLSKKARYIIACSINSFHIHDLNKENFENDYVEIKLDELETKYTVLLDLLVSKEATT